MTKNTKTILVTGATGTQGGAVARHLLQSGWKIKALTRNPESEKAKALKRLGATLVKGDLNNPEELSVLLENVYGVFSVQNTWTAGLEGEVSQGKNLAQAAKAANIQHFVYTSVGGGSRITGIPHFDSKHEIEEYVKSLGIPYTIIRPSFFFENFLTLPGMKEQLQQGQVSFGQLPKKPLQMIHADDIGGIVAKIFENPDNYLKREIEISGDELTLPNALNKLGAKLGKEIHYNYVPFEQFTQMAGEEMALMFKWFNEHGYCADIENVKEIYPSLHSFDQWLKKSEIKL